MRPRLDFSKVVPEMKAEIEAFISSLGEEGKNMEYREAVRRWMDEKYEAFLAERMNRARPSEGENKRSHERVPLELDVFYRILWTPSGEAAPESAPAVIAGAKNISAGGLYIVSGTAYPLSTLLEVQFDLPGLPDPVSAFAMVVWREVRDDGRFGLGLHFSHIEVPLQRAIEDLILEGIIDAPVVEANQG